MAFNIQEFQALGVQDGLARPSFFAVRLSAVPSGVPDATSDLRYVCTATESPSSTISPIEVPYFGRTIKVAGNRTYDDWTVTIYNQEGMKHRNMFEAWHNKINAVISNRQDSDQSALMDYKVSAEVLQYGKAGPGDDSGVIRGYQFEGLWPNRIGAMQLSWDAGNQIQTFDVTFSCDFWIPSIFSDEAAPFTGILAPDPLGVVQNG